MSRTFDAALALLALALVSTCAPSPDERPAEAEIAGMPDPRGGGALVGRSLASLRFLSWIGEPVPLAQDAAREPTGPRATLLRWWTDACPYCEASLPALEELRTRFAGEGLAVVAVYHPKPPGAVSNDDVAAAARRLGFAGTVAVDPSWKALEQAWPESQGRGATSVSLLLDAHGTVRFTHPGPEFHPPRAGLSGPDHERCSSDFADLEQAIGALLARG